MAKRQSDGPSDLKKVKKSKKSTQAPGKESKEDTTTGLSLFSGKADADVDEVFGKSSVLAQAEPRQGSPIAPSNQLDDEDSQESASEVAEGQVDAASEADGSDDSDDAGSKVEVLPEGEEGEADGSSDAESSASAAQDLVHESLKPKGPKHSVKRYIPAEETPEDRNRRTVFVGNLPITVAQSKSALSQLRQHILTFCPGAKVESTRLRSVPFANPTTARPLPPNAADPKGKGKALDEAALSSARSQREKNRTAAWREETGMEDPAAGGKVFLDSKGKRKVAFIKKKFHDSAGTCNAYVVFAHPPPDRPKNLPPILDPYTAAEQALKANGSTFMEHIIRVDSAHKQSSSDGVASQKFTTPTEWLAGADPKLSVFVGGLDYETKEDDLRAYFESLVQKERGARAEKYVKAVRIVRDRDTQLGKGFGYVHFKDAESVDEMLALDAKLKFAKRPIRIQRCKARPQQKIATSSTSNTAASSVSTKGSAAGKRSSSAGGKPIQTGPIPKGDPKLGDRLKGLSKDERKSAKASDSDRQARRMAKKKLKHRSDGSREKGAVKLGGKDKQRHAGGYSGKVKAKKSRVRSEHALSKMKGSRA